MTWVKKRPYKCKHCKALFEFKGYYRHVCPECVSKKIGQGRVYGRAGKR